MIRKTLATILALCLFPLALFACAQPQTDNRPTIVTTVFPQYDFVRQIAGDTVNLIMLVPVGGESHSYEPTPRDMAAVEECDLFIEIGGPSEQWAAELRSSEASEVRVLSLIELEGITLTYADDSGHEHSLEHVRDFSHSHEIDEHLWLSPRNAAIMVEAICDRLCTILPECADLYRTNTDRYLTELDQLDARFTSIAANSTRQTLIFGDRFPFRYLTEAYGLTAYAAYPGCSAEGEPAPATVAALIERVKAEQIPVVFTIEFSRGEIADTICAETGAKRLELHSCHNLSIADFDAGITYLDLMHRNADVLEQALN